jgi:hypothetical protein
MMARHPTLGGRDGKLVPMLVLDFTDPNRTRWPVAEAINALGARD